jgi:hypothetical protein
MSGRAASADPRRRHFATQGKASKARPVSGQRTWMDESPRLALAAHPCDTERGSALGCLRRRQRQPSQLQGPSHPTQRNQRS